MSTSIMMYAAICVFGGIGELTGKIETDTWFIIVLLGGSLMGIGVTLEEILQKL